MGTYSKEQDLTSLLKKREVPGEIIKQISAVGWTDAVEFAAGLDRDQLHDLFLVGTKFDSSTHRAGTPQVRLGPASRGSPLYVGVQPSAGVRMRESSPLGLLPRVLLAFGAPSVWSALHSKRRPRFKHPRDGLLSSRGCLAFYPPSQPAKVLFRCLVR